VILHKLDEELESLGVGRKLSDFPKGACLFFSRLSIE